MGIDPKDYQQMRQQLAGAHLRAAHKRAPQQPGLFEPAVTVRPPPIPQAPAAGDMEFFVPGVPAPGGSKSFIPIWHRTTGDLIIVWRNGRPWPAIRVVDSADVGSNRVSKWKNVVRHHAGDFMFGARPYKCPMRVEFIFFMPRPQFHFGTGKNAMLIKESSPQFHTVKPDALKLARSTEDALTGIIFDDDAANVSIQSEKRWCNHGEQSGVLIKIVKL